MSEERRAEVRHVPMEPGDERRRDLPRPHLLAMAQRCRARTEERTRRTRKEPA